MPLLMMRNSIPSSVHKDQLSQNVITINERKFLDSVMKPTTAFVILKTLSFIQFHNIFILQSSNDHKMIKDQKKLILV